MRAALLSLLLLCSCGGRIACPIGDPTGPCTFPPGLECKPHTNPNYSECRESRDVTWILFPDGVAWRMAGDETMVCDLSCS
jgi:hypothetical protein